MRDVFRWLIGGIYENHHAGNAKATWNAARVRRHTGRLHRGAVTSDSNGALSTTTDCSAAGLLDLQPTAKKYKLTTSMSELPA